MLWVVGSDWHSLNLISQCEDVRHEDNLAMFIDHIIIIIEENMLKQDVYELEKCCQKINQCPPAWVLSLAN